MIEVNADPRSARTLTGPPAKHSKLGEWLSLLLCVVAAGVLLLVWLGRPHVTDAEEARAVDQSLETFRRLTGGAGSYLVPHYNGEPQLGEMPGLTWWHLVVMHKVAPAELGVDEAIYWCRLGTVLLALLGLASVFWAGHSVGGARAGVFAALVYMANPLFVYYGRLASGTMPMLSLVTLSVAGGLWATRPFKPAPSVERQFIGWVTCGLALGLALLVAGLPAFVMVVGPLVVILLICPGRSTHLLGLLAAILIGLLMFLPWAVYVYENVRDPWDAWLAPFRWPVWANVGQYFSQVTDELWLLVLALLPWSIWLVGAATQPLSSSSKGERSRMLLAWAWVVTAVAVDLLIPQQMTMASKLLLLPPLAVLVASLFDLYKHLAGTGRYPRSWRWTRWVMLGALAIGTLGLPLAIQFEDRLVTWGYLDHQRLGGQSWYYTAGMLVVLAGVLLLTARWAYRHYPAKALMGWASWMVIVLLLGVFPIVKGPASRTPWRGFALRVASEAGAEPLIWLKQEEPPAQLLLYMGRTVSEGSAEEAYKALVDEPEVLLLGPSGGEDGSGPTPRRMMLAAMGEGKTARLRFRLVDVLEGQNLALWRMSLE